MFLWDKVCGFGLIASFLVLSACGGDNAVNGSSHREPLLETSLCQDANFESNTYDDLPACTGKKEGLTACVQSSMKVYVCEEGEWNRLVESSSSAPKQNGSSSSKTVESSSSEGDEKSCSSVDEEQLDSIVPNVSIKSSDLSYRLSGDFVKFSGVIRVDADAAALGNDFKINYVTYNVAKGKYISGDAYVSLGDLTIHDELAAPVSAVDLNTTLGLKIDLFDNEVLKTEGCGDFTLIISVVAANADGSRIVDYNTAIDFVREEADFCEVHEESSSSAYYASFPTRQDLAVQTMYANWIAKFYVTYEEEAHEPIYLGEIMNAKLAGSARIKFDSPQNTVSEGIGYGMLITALMNDWERFNRLFKYYQAYPVSAESGMYCMKWMVKGEKLDGVTGNGGFSADATGGSATDADLDVVTALFLAYMKTGVEEYKNYALLVGGSILQTEVNATTHLLMPGNDGLHMNDGYVYNISYFSLVALKLLAQYDVAHAAEWNQVLDASIAYMTKVQAAGNGLWPDWSNADGVPTDPENGSSTGRNNNYWGLEGVRIPLRIMWYYNWFGDERVKAMAMTAANFAVTATGGDISKTWNKYIYQGEQTQSGLGGAHFKGAFCSLMTVDPSFITYAENCNTLLAGIPFSSNAFYYETTLQLLYALFLNGYFVMN